MEKVQRAKRVPIQCEVGFRRHGDARYRIDLIDFSAEGCCIAPPVKVEAGERVFLRFADMEAIVGRVAWIKDWRVGVKFDQPIHPAVFDAVVSRLGPQPSATSHSVRAHPRSP